MESLQRAGVEAVIRALASSQVGKGAGRASFEAPTFIDSGGFEEVAKALLDQQRSGVAVIFDRVAGPGFLQLATPVVGADSTTLEFGLPNAEWAASGWDRLLASLRRQGFQVELEVASEGIGFDMFLRVRVQGSSDALARPGAALLETAREHFGWLPESRYLVRPVSFRQDDGADPPGSVVGRVE